jgi:hypothetical protein
VGVLLWVLVFRRFVVGSCFWVLVAGFLFLGVFRGVLVLDPRSWSSRPLRGRYLLVRVASYRLRVKVCERFRERVFAGEGRF